MSLACIFLNLRLLQFPTLSFAEVVTPDIYVLSLSKNSCI